MERTQASVEESRARREPDDSGIPLVFGAIAVIGIVVLSILFPPGRGGDGGYHGDFDVGGGDD